MPTRGGVSPSPRVGVWRYKTLASVFPFKAHSSGDDEQASNAVALTYLIRGAKGGYQPRKWRKLDITLIRRNTTDMPSPTTARVPRRVREPSAKNIADTEVTAVLNQSISPVNTAKIACRIGGSVVDILKILS